MQYHRSLANGANPKHGETLSFLVVGQRSDQTGLVFLRSPPTPYLSSPTTSQRTVAGRTKAHHLIVLEKKTCYEKANNLIYNALVPNFDTLSVVERAGKVELADVELKSGLEAMGVKDGMAKYRETTRINDIRESDRVSFHRVLKYNPSIGYHVQSLRLVAPPNDPRHDIVGILEHVCPTITKKRTDTERDEEVESGFEDIGE